jgi:hypothetical protein
MRALAERAREEESPYEFVLYWHLGHDAPGSDDDFVSGLCNLLRDQLAASSADYTEHRAYLGDHTFGVLREVTDLLDSEGKAILMLWDGFDKPLGQGRLSGHLWDQMRTIFYGKRHKIVTATRGPLRELIRSQEAITSPFWNIFDMNPVRVEVFDEDDCEAILSELSGIKFQQGAKTELMNWSSGFPPLFLEVLNQVVVETPSGSVDNKDINRVVGRATERLAGVISSLWEDCTAGAQDVYFHLVERGDLLLSEVGKDEQRCLTEKGFARQSGNKLIRSCRMLQEYIQSRKPDAGSMVRLFGTREDYRSNIRSLLERRLAQISQFDDRLRRLVARAIGDIPDYPEDCLNNLTSIEERALDLIWQREFGQDKVIPQEILDYWDRVDSTVRPVEYLREQTEKVVPGDRGLQCGILQLLTGSRRDFDSRAKYVTKNTYVLINAIHSFRNRSQHSAGQEMHVGVAVVAIMGCLELLACLDRELAT